jgi:hypothetical protein
MVFSKKGQWHLTCDALSPADDLPLTTSVTGGCSLPCCARKIKLTNSIDYNALVVLEFSAAGF